MGVDAVELKALHGQVLDRHVVNLVQRDADRQRRIRQAVVLRQHPFVDAEIEIAAHQAPLARLQLRHGPFRRVDRPLHRRAVVDEQLLISQPAGTEAERAAQVELPGAVGHREPTRPGSPRCRGLSAALCSSRSHRLPEMLTFRDRAARRRPARCDRRAVPAATLWRSSVRALAAARAVGHFSQEAVVPRHVIDKDIAGQRGGRRHGSRPAGSPADGEDQGDKVPMREPSRLRGRCFTL